MPNNNTSNILQGLIAALAIGNKFRDPNKDQRNKLTELLQARPDLIQQYKDQGNPEIAKTLAGMKPRFGSSGGYDKLTSLINNTPDSPDTIRNKKIKDIYKKAESDTKTASGYQGMYSPVVKEVIGNSDAVQSADEYTRAGKISSPEERKGEQLRLTQQSAATKEGLARLDLAQAEAKAKQEERDRVTAARKLALPAKARVYQNGGTNLYKAILDGKVSGEEKNAMWADPNTAEEIRNDRQAWIDQEGKKMGESQKIEMRYNAVATDLFKDAMDAGTPIGFDQAIEFAKNPKLADSNPTIKKAISGVKDFNRRKVLPNAHANFLREAAPIYKNIQTNDGEATAEDVNALNTASTNAFGGTGFEPITYGLVDVNNKEGKPKTKGLVFKDKIQVIGIVGGDPELIAKYKGQHPVQVPEAKQTGVNGTQESQAQMFDRLGKKYPNETDEQIKARVLKGEK